VPGPLVPAQIQRFDLRERNPEIIQFLSLSARSSVQARRPLGVPRVPHPRAGRRDRPAPVPGAGPPVRPGGGPGLHLRLPHARRGPSRDLGVQVLARLRPWLAPLLAITANSPIADGHDTGWASWRYLLWSRWPGDDRDTCETGHGLMLMPPIRGLTCGWLPQWSVVRWLSASALSCSVGKLYCRVVSRRECPMSSATTTRSVLPRKLVESNVPTLSSTSAGAGELGIIPHGW